MTNPSITHGKLAEARAALRDPQLAAEICHEILSSHDTAQPDRTVCEAHYLLGVSLRLAGNHADAEAELLYAHQLANELNDKSLRSDCALDLGHLAIETMQYGRAIELITDAVELIDISEESLRRPKAIYALANACWLVGEHDRALRLLEEAMLCFTKAHSDEGIFAVLCCLIHMDIDRGREKEAEERIDLCMKLFPQDLHIKNRLFLRLTLAECYMKQGRNERALEILQATTMEANTEGYHFLEAQGLMLMYSINKAQGKLDAGEEMRQHASELARLHGFVPAFEAIQAKAIA